MGGCCRMCIGGIMECYVGLVMNRVACLPFLGGNGYHTLSKTANHHFASAAHDDTS